MFVDASAMIAVMTGEPERPRCSEAITGAASPITSVIAVWEAASALTRSDKLGVKFSVAADLVMKFVEERGIQVRDLPPPREALEFWTEAAARYRKNTIRLNLGDCFHYACAKYYQVPILATANEFRLTDLETVP